MSTKALVELPRRGSGILPWMDRDLSMRSEAELVRVSSQKVLLCLVYAHLVHLLTRETNNRGLREQRNRGCTERRQRIGKNVRCLLHPLVIIGLQGLYVDLVRKRIYHDAPLDKHQIQITIPPARDILTMDNWNL